MEISKTKLIVIISLLVAGIFMIYLGYVNNNVSSKQLDNVAVTVIDVSKGRNQLNIPTILGGVLILFALILTSLSFRQGARVEQVQATEKLTLQETKVIDLMKEKKTNKEIALALSISPNTVKTHINNIYKKLEVNSRSELLSKY